MPEITRFYGIVISLVKEWAEKNIEELQAMWDSKTLKRLPPLE